MEDDSIRLWGETDADAEIHHDNESPYHHSLPINTSESNKSNKRLGLERRLSDPAVNARQAITPKSKGKRKKRRQPEQVAAAQSAQAAAATRAAPSVGGRLYPRSVSASSMQSSKSSPSLEDGLQQVQVRWADDPTKARSPTGHATSSTASSSISELSSPLPSSSHKKHHNLQSSSALSLPSGSKKHHNSQSSSALSLPTSSKQNTTLFHSEDGFGQVVKSPKAKKIVKSTATATATATATVSAAAVTSSSSSRRRTNRNVEPALRISQTDPFEPVDDLFGDFAFHSYSNHGDDRGNKTLGSFQVQHHSDSKINAGSINQYNDDDDDDDESSDEEDESSDDMDESMGDFHLASTKTKPRLWASMSHISHSHSNEEGNGSGGLATIGETTTIKRSIDHGAGSTKTTTTKLMNGSTLKGIINKKPIYSKSLSGNNLIKTTGNKQIELAPTNIISALTSPPVQSNNSSNNNSRTELAVSPKPTTKKTKKKKETHRRRNSDPIQLMKALVPDLVRGTDHQTVATTGTGIMSSATINTTSTSVPADDANLDTKAKTTRTAVGTSKDDLFLLAMQKFATKAEMKATKKELKAEKKKLKKEKSIGRKIKKKITRRRRRLSLGAAEEELFNVEDQSEFFGESGDGDDDTESDLAALLSSPEAIRAHYVEIEWNPPESVIKEELAAKATAEAPHRMARRASAPVSSANEPYEPITPTFVYDKKKRKSTKSGGSAAPPASLVPPFALGDDDNSFMEETATAVDMILNQDSASSLNADMDSSGGRPKRRLSVAQSMQLLDQMDQSHKSWQMSHRSETAFSSMHGDPEFTARDLDRSSKSAAEPRRSYTPQKKSRSRTKTKRRESTSVLEMSSSRGEDKKAPRPQTARPGDKHGRTRSRSRSKSPLPPSSTRSKSKSSGSRAKTRGSTPDLHEQRIPSKKSSSRRSATSKSPDRKLREARSKSPESRAMSRSEKSSASHKGSPLHSDSNAKRKPGDSRSSSKNPSRRRSSMPASHSDSARSLDRSKARSKSRRRQQTNAMSQSQPSLSSKEKEKKKSRPKSSSHKTVRRSTMSHSKPPREQKRSKSPKREKRRASLSSIEAATPKQHPSSEAASLTSWAALTAESDDQLDSGGKQEGAP